MRVNNFYCWAILEPAEDLPGQWVAHCLDFDVVTYGNSLEHSLKMLLEATAMVICDDLERGADPSERRAPEEYWQRLSHILMEGDRFSSIAALLDSIDENQGAPMVAAQLQLDIAVINVNKELVERPQVPFFVYPQRPHEQLAAC